MGGGLSRRSFLKGAGVLGVLAVLPGELVRQVVTRTAEAAEPHYFLDAHQYATVEALCRRLIPGPHDDPTEPDPGALEANVIAYIDLFLGAFNIPAPLGPRIWGDGPFSGRAGPPPWPFGTPQPTPYPDDFARSYPLSAVDVLSWRTLLEGTRDAHGHPIPQRAWADAAAGGRYIGLQEQYVQGVKDLDAAAAQMFPTAKDFVSLSPQQQDILIARPDIETGFPSVVFQNAAEGMYGAPEYGGNKDLVGWKYIGFPGDAQPR
ncbi:MAG: gluconate 2-dehydrogenase subunit 3 family protein, partial [Acidimicrobiia bacterium]|nr:gluconate 2-dehydrogenase subunit 3 family protein [Acidimicrobiia bacterium]